MNRGESMQEENGKYRPAIIGVARGRGSANIPPPKLRRELRKKRREKNYANFPWIFLHRISTLK